MNVNSRYKEKNRLETIASFVDKGSVVADIGSDHCQIPILLCKQGKCSFVQAVENKRGPYKKMCDEILKSGYSSIIRASLSNGISELSEEVDTLVLAGMGGRLIKNILQSNEAKLSRIKTIIIDAHSDKELIFDYMVSISYVLQDNKFIYDAGKPYDVQKWIKSPKKKEYSDIQKVFGPLNLQRRPESWVHYWEVEKKRILEIIAKEDLPKETEKKLLNQLSKIDESVLNTTN